MDPIRPEAKLADEMGLEELLDWLSGLKGPVTLGVRNSLGLIHRRHLPPRCSNACLGQERGK
jgi:hypothetical protein